MTATDKPKRKRSKDKLPRLSEAEFMEQLIAYLQLQGWRVHHVRPGFGRGGYKTQVSGNPGFPDIVASHCGRVAFLEIKGEGTKLEMHQVQWLNALAGTLTLTGGSLAWWDATHGGTPNHATRGNDGGWDVLVAVVRPCHFDWFKSAFCTIGAAI